MIIIVAFNRLMEKRKRFDDELLDLVNPGADDSFLNEYLEDEETKKKLKKSSPLKTIKISFKKFSQSNEQQTLPTVSAQAQTSTPLSPKVQETQQLINPPVQSRQSPQKGKGLKQNRQSDVKSNAENESKGKIKVLNDKRLDYKPKDARFLGTC